MNRFETHFVAYYAYFTAKLHQLFFKRRQFENLVFVIVSIKENIRLIARTPLLQLAKGRYWTNTWNGHAFGYFPKVALWIWHLVTVGCQKVLAVKCNAYFQHLQYYRFKTLTTLTMIVRSNIIMPFLRKGQNIELLIVDGCLATRQKWPKLPYLVQSKQSPCQPDIPYSLNFMTLPERYTCIDVSMYWNFIHDFFGFRPT